MATARDVITRAMRKAKVLASGEEPTADEAADGLDELNDMLHAWRNDGIDLGHATLALPDTLDVPDDHIDTIRLSLAERIVGDFGGALTPFDVDRAANGRTALRALYFNIADLRSDNPLSRTNLANDW